jgi:hypothetical protein
MRWILISLSAVAFVAVGSTALRADTDERPFAVLAEPRESDDALPAEVLESRTAAYDLGDPASARRVGAFHDGTYYMMEGAAADHICLVRHEQDVNVVAICADDGGQYERAPSFSVYDKEFRRATATIVPDGYTSALLKLRGGKTRRVPISRNVAFFSTSRAGRLELSGPEQPTLTAPIRAMRAIGWRR